MCVTDLFYRRQNASFFLAASLLTLPLELRQDQSLTDPQAYALDRVAEAKHSEVPRQCRGSPLLAQDLPRRFFLEQVEHLPPIVREVDVICSCIYIPYHTNRRLILGRILQAEHTARGKKKKDAGV